MPNDFFGRNGDMWRVVVNADTGQIVGWNGKGKRVYMKVVDQGTYELLDGSGTVIASVNQDYVPHCIPNDYSDYLNFDIDSNGIITNWPKRFVDISEFTFAE